MNAARALPDPLERLMVLLLARTGLRRRELLGLTVDKVFGISSSNPAGCRFELMAMERFSYAAVPSVCGG